MCIRDRANIGQAAPAIGLIVLLAFIVGFGFTAAVIALVSYACLLYTSRCV